MDFAYMMKRVIAAMTAEKWIARACRAVCAALVAVVLAAPVSAQQRFPNPEAAVDALVAALKSNNEAALITLFGEKHKNLVVTGDPAHDQKVRADAAAQLGLFRTLEEQGSDRRILLMGPEAWPVPIPLVREGGSWYFATEEGAEEMLNRRIGRNERNAIYVLRSYIDAQREYASRDRVGDGVLQYARRIASNAGKRDGLYWPANQANGEEPSPFGPLISEASAYLAGHKAGDPYRGYYFRILTRQGKHAAGGPYNYIINGRMIAGFAMVAYPAVYDETGVMTFIVNHNGKIYERDLGKNTLGIASKMVEFDPGPGWKEVAP